ncbi:hypothetical protein ACFVTF_33825 [Kitasatospora sp. NPDC057940]|uniref:hypothetical protein n=1 Tax=Kitasatospora sp. NPDC057940 TaxID=3346285 RepID=UPI0036D9BF87
MTDIDPLVPALAGLLIDNLWFLDSCDEDEVDSDSAVRVLESAASALKGLPPEQLDRFLLVIGNLTEAETDPGRREFMEAFPFACGLVEEV